MGIESANTRPSSLIDRPQIAIDLLENQSVSAPIFQQQKKAIVSNLVRQINALDILDSEEIQAAIRQAEIDYYMNLAFKREQDDEAVLMLLLN